MNTYGYTNPLSYDMIKKLKDGDKETINAIINTTNCTLCKQLLDSMPLELEWEKCYHIKTSILDDMNVVATINEVKIDVEQLHIPSVEKINIPTNKKLSFKDRLKILFTGGI